MVQHVFKAVFAFLFLVSPTLAADPPRTRAFDAKDTFTNQIDEKPKAQAALDKIKWKPVKFEVVCETPLTGEEAAADPLHSDYDALVRFPSPHPDGNKHTDTVVMEWYAPRDENGKVQPGPAMVILDILDGRMVISRGFARTFREKGIHSFIMHMPHYGRRREPGSRLTAALLMTGTRQAAADARRARDAVAALPNVDSKRIGIQGTSLGGFICVGAASLDDAFDPVLPLLAGGDLVTLFENGKHEIERIKENAARVGLTMEALKEILIQVEPNQLAHRISAKKCWMFNAEDDEVIPAANAKALAKAIGLEKEHHVWISGGHVSCIVNLPKIMPTMIERIKGKP